MINAVLEPVNMNLAWDQVCSKRGAPGLDGISLERWGRNWEENLERLRHQVMTNTYYPGRPKRISVRKKGGGIRELCLFNVSDKVLQRAVLNIIEPEFNKRFLPCSHGYRPKRSTATAVQQVLSHRDQGLKWVLDADIEACFDSIDQKLLLERVERVVRDWHLLQLMEGWLKVSHRQRRLTVGIPAGAVVSPLWCNIYLHVLDAHITCARFKMVRYADDFLVMTRDRAEAESAKQLVVESLAYLQLKLALSKTCITHFDEGFRFLGVEFLRDTYSYTWEQKKIKVKGRNLKMLYKHLPYHY